MLLSLYPSRPVLKKLHSRGAERTRPNGAKEVEVRERGARIYLQLPCGFDIRVTMHDCNGSQGADRQGASFPVLTTDNVQRRMANLAWLPDSVG